MNNVKIDFVSESELLELKKVYNANKIVGNFVIKSIGVLSNSLTLDNKNLDKDLKKLTELKVIIEYLVKLGKNLKERGENLVASKNLVSDDNNGGEYV